VKKIKVDVSLSFCLLVDIQAVPNSQKRFTGTLYILFKLQEKEEDEAISLREYIL